MEPWGTSALESHLNCPLCQKAGRGNLRLDNTHMTVAHLKLIPVSSRIKLFIYFFFINQTVHIRLKRLPCRYLKWKKCVLGGLYSPHTGETTFPIMPRSLWVFSGKDYPVSIIRRGERESKRIERKYTPSIGLWMRLRFRFF